MAANDNLDLILRRHQEISARLADGASGAQYSALSRELSELEPVVTAIQAFLAKEKERADLMALLREPDLDPDMRAMASSELAEAEAEADAMSKAIRIALLPKDAADEGGAIIEVRAGTGGDEAALFAGDLFRMYVKYAERKRWKVEVLSSSEGTAGGFKEIVAEVSGRGVFARLKFESGVHRVQRVPTTETQGRIHTSAATVAVLPIAEEADFVINEADLKIDTYRSSGAGGQHVNKTNRRSASPTCRPAWWSRCRRSGRSIAIAPRRWRFYGHASSTPKTRSWTPIAPRSGVPRSAPATGRSASAPIISRKGGSPTTASI